MVHDAGPVLPSAAPCFSLGFIVFEKRALKTANKRVGRTVIGSENVTSSKRFKEQSLLTPRKGTERGELIGDLQYIQASCRQKVIKHLLTVEQEQDCHQVGFRVDGIATITTVKNRLSVAVRSHHWRLYI